MASIKYNYLIYPLAILLIIKSTSSTLDVTKNQFNLTSLLEKISANKTHSDEIANLEKSKIIYNSAIIENIKNDVKNDLKNSLIIDVNNIKLGNQINQINKLDYKIIKQNNQSINQNNNYQIEDTNEEKWSDWSECENCGLSVQIQRLEIKKSDFSSIKYKVCKKQDCDPSKEDIRQRQCSHFNRIPYTDGQHYFWRSVYVASEPCSLFCNAYLKNENGILTQAFNHSIKLQDWVIDGTGCSNDALNKLEDSLCINNKCMFVDCELNLNGRLKYDACGVCGGDNSTCNLNSNQNNLQTKEKEHIEFIWKYADYGECIPDCNQDELRSDIENEPSDEIGNSNAFTIGFQTSYPICFKRIRSRHNLEERIVNLDNCDQDQKPSIQIRSCENFIYHCKPRWIKNDWSNCTVNCGIGYQKRDIYCGLISRLNDTNGKPEQILRVDSVQCAGQSRPSVHRQCEAFDCSEWFSGPWSECSVSCGQGTQNREVTCRDKDGKLSTECKLNLKPLEQQLCLKDCIDADDFGLVKDQPDSSSQKSTNTENLDEEPTWIAGEWGSCSAECNHGKQQRTVECKMLFKFSGTVATLPDDQCHADSKPKQEQSCFVRPCDDENEIEPQITNKFHHKKSKNSKHHLFDKLSKNKFINEEKEPIQPIIALSSEAHRSTTILDSSINEISNRNDDSQSNFNDFLSPYQWIIAGFTDCTAQCLGGTQDSIIQCVHRSNNSEVSPSLCNLSTRPEYVTRVCNDSPCAPRWNVSEWSECSKQCGKGIQTREINCIHEVTRGEENVIQLPNSNCTHLPPSVQQFCAIQDCESRWVVGEYSPCKQRCGRKGKSVRSVKCFRLLAYGEDVEVPEIHCKDKRKPKFKKRCIANTCIPPKAKIFPQNKLFDQNKKLQKSDQSGKYLIDNSSGFKRTHIDFKKLEEDQKKWKEIKNFVDSDVNVEQQESKIKKNQTINNWNKIIESNNIVLESINNNYSTSKYRTPKMNQNKLNFKDNKYNNRKDQNIHNNNLNNFINQNNHLNKGYEGMITSSAVGSHSNSVMLQLHHLQNLLTKLLTRKSIKKIKKDLIDKNDTNVNSLDKDNQIETNEIEDQEEEIEDERLANNIVNKLLLDTGIKNFTESLAFDWAKSDWSLCYGFQIRGIQCKVKLGNTTKAVNEAMCLNAGLRKPSTIRRCGAEWRVQDWSTCKFCIKASTGIQTRIVECIQQGTNEPVSSKFCDPQSKPDNRRECKNLECNSEETQTNSPINNEEEIDEERVDEDKIVL